MEKRSLYGVAILALFTLLAFPSLYQLARATFPFATKMPASALVLSVYNSFRFWGGVLLVFQSLFTILLAANQYLDKNKNHEESIEKRLLASMKDIVFCSFSLIISYLFLLYCIEKYGVEAQKFLLANGTVLPAPIFVVIMIVFCITISKGLFHVVFSLRDNMDICYSAKAPG